MSDTKWTYGAEARQDIDSYSPPWSSFAEFFGTRGRSEQAYLLARSSDDDKLVQWTTAEWQRVVCSVADRLTEHGVKAGDNVVTLAGNTPEALALAFATWLLGACLVPFDTGERDERHREILAALGASYLCVGPRPDMLSRAKKHTGNKIIRIRDLLLSRSGQVPSIPAANVVPLDVPALRIYSSGTTGSPKSIVLTMRSILLNCESMRRGFGWTDETRVMTVLPIHHVNGLLINSFLPWFVGGSTVLNEKFRAGMFWAAVDESGATTSSLVPTILEILLAQDHEPRPTTRMRQIISGSAPLRPETAVAFETRFGIAVRQIYGLSENTAVLTVTPERENDVLPGELRASVGWVVPHVQVEVLDSEGKPCREDQVGEIVARGGMLMAGYGDDNIATLEAFRGGWFHSGDLGHWHLGDDGKKWYFIDGRVKDVIIRGGETIIPEIIDSVVEAHPDVARAAAVGFPNRWYGEEIAVYVVADGEVSEAQLLQWCSERLSYPMTPKVVLFGTDLPLTTLGKVRRKVLAQQAAHQLATHWDTSFREPRL